MSQEQIDNFMAITSAETPELATQFLDMAGGNLDIAISLFFEHGGNAQLKQSTPAPTTTANINSSNMGNSGDNDEELAQRLQNEAYNEGQAVRAPDEARHETLTETHVFPGTYGGIGGSFNPLRGIGSGVNDMFDNSTPPGIFNQRLTTVNGVDEDAYGTFEPDSNSDISDLNEDDDDEDDDYELVEEPVVELDEDGTVQESTKWVRRPKGKTKEERLAILFRPPFKIMSKLNLEGARMKARKKNKWIMINIQDSGVFQCQALNRDLWSSKDVKRLLKKNFIFLQYQYESRNAEPYLNFYPLPNKKDDLPHIAILDPITGERVKQWNQDVPKISSFIKDINQFLSDYSLDPKSTNPTVKEPTPELDPTTLTEEQQMELAIQQSLGNSSSKPITFDDKEIGLDNDGNGGEEDDTAIGEAEETHESIFENIRPVHHMEPLNKPGITTRIQIRTGDGKRIVRRVNAMDDKVRTLYEIVKSEIEGYDSCAFTLSDHQRNDLIDKVDMSISDAGLKNSSLLLEKVIED
ncbi:DNA protein crosslink repair co-factor UBX5 NDAI_0C04440 [Naumovozyma dairenensis CBS 421]|uniref:UBX domain-containing protein n=1 Tax=Naumovozyma dairenensis (strain ATCC 10597 / BCRC 20456 / CBS 421 / NBRC 0211 / NRRL Y-12639) TaxID=1071378 RepID=G0W8J3_NAUDC|nr:hypothetical protein NDAI_0C04440 [Naumovozyma dairenensis CBS 421]CCD24104.1 hypothetical protein NDAI_0C04440 [Naumovozyma dairenensis CBS 421]